MVVDVGAAGPDGDLFSIIVESAPDGIVIVGRDGHIEVVNRQIEELFGVPRAELIGQPIEVLVPDHLRTAHAAHRTDYGSDPRPRPMGAGAPLVGRHRDGHEVEVDISLSPLGPGASTVAIVRDVSARRDEERKVAYLAAIVESSDDAIFGQDVDGRIASWNRGAERVYGYREDEIIGQPATKLAPSWMVDDWVSHHQRVLGGERIERVETETVRKDGLPVPVSLTMSPIVDARGTVVGLSTIARDRTEQQLSLETLADAAQRLREGEALAHVGGWVLDRATADVQWSEELHRIHGIEPADFAGTVRAHLGRVHPDDRDDVAAAFDAALRSGDHFEREYRIQRPDRTTRWLYATAYPVRNGSGDVIGLRGICQDVTERRQAEDSIREAYARERAAAEELRVADQVKDEFLATVSHELRTPLTVILGFARLVEQAGTPREDVVAPIVRNADEMHRMIERLLDFTRLQAGKVHHAVERLMLLDEVERCVKGLGPVLSDHAVHLEIDPRMEVDADPDGLSRVLGNLLGNAAKFSPAGTTIVVRATEDDGRSIVAVTDQGRGIAPELQARVFDRFFQGPGQPPGKRGTGIGLAIAKRHVELMGGRIWCDPAVPGGATFAFSLPASPRPGSGA